MSARDAAVFAREPLSECRGIPVFSRVDAYVENYQRIAADHVAAMQRGVSNPFIGDELWRALEGSTRQLVVKYAAEGARILDVGVGLGRLLGPLPQYERHGIDISFDYLEAAARAGIGVAFARIEDMPYGDGTFDVVVATDVLEHVFDLSECYRRILGVLRPGGTLIVRVPYKEDLDPYLGAGLPYRFIHLRSFDEAALRLPLEKAFSMEFLEAATAAPFLQGSPRLKVRLPNQRDRARLLEACSLMSECPAYLKHVTELSEEEFLRWIYEFRDTRRADYERVADALVLGMELNAVFRKRDERAGAPG